MVVRFMGVDVGINGLVDFVVKDVVDMECIELDVRR